MMFSCLSFVYPPKSKIWPGRDRRSNDALNCPIGWGRLKSTCISLFVDIANHRQYSTTSLEFGGR